MLPNNLTNLHNSAQKKERRHEETLSLPDNALKLETENKQAKRHSKDKRRATNSGKHAKEKKESGREFKR